MTLNVRLYDEKKCLITSKVHCERGSAEFIIEFITELSNILRGISI